MHSGQGGGTPGLGRGGGGGGAGAARQPARMTSRGDSGCAGCRDTSWDWPSLSTAPSSLAAVLGRAGEQCRSTTAGEARAGCCTSGCIVTSKQQRHTTVAAATCAANAGLQRSFVGNCCFGACEQQLIAGAAARTTASGSGSFHTFQIHCSCVACWVDPCTGRPPGLPAAGGAAAPL